MGPSAGAGVFRPQLVLGALRHFRMRGRDRRPGRGVLGTWKEAATRVQSEVMRPCGAKFETQSSERDPMCARMRDRELAVSVHKEACVARTRSTDLPFPHRMPTSPRSVLFLLAPTAASWPPEGLTASSSSGMLWEVRVAAHRQAQSFLSRPHPQLAPLWERCWVSLCLLTRSALWAVAR